jgi:hypothetical protein
LKFRCLSFPSPRSSLTFQLGWSGKSLVATNIGTNFTRLMADRPPIRSMTDEDLAFHRASLCLGCD